MIANSLVRLGELGQSPWYDYITRDLITSGELRRLIEEDGLRGMTSNPTIFEKAVATSALYDEDIRRLANGGASAAEIFEAIAVADVRAACDEFRGIYDASEGADGLVSLEVSPTLANDTDGTIHEAERLWHALDRPNAMIKIPGTKAGLPAITHCLAAGINVNITLLFAVERYAEVIEAFLRGLSRRGDAGLPVHTIASVASFFVSRLDGKIDPILDRRDPHHPLRGKAAVANACAAYRLFESSLGRPQWDRLAKAGARPQRPLWASTSTKDPRFPDVYYVEALVAPRTVNTLPPETFAAYRDHGNPAIRIHEGVAVSQYQLNALAGAGVDLAAITHELEDEGIEKFASSYHSVIGGIAAKVTALAVPR